MLLNLHADQSVAERDDNGVASARAGQPKLLVSVASAAEAQIALKHGADIIDCKDPAVGALAPLSLQDVTSVCRTVDNATPVAATVGVVERNLTDCLDMMQLFAATGVDLIKIGFGLPRDARQHRALASDIQQCGRAGMQLLQGRQLVAVVFAENLTSHAQFAAFTLHCSEAGFHGVMIDTLGKRSGNVLSQITKSFIVQAAQEVRSHGLFFGLAGGLRLSDVPMVSALGPDVVGLRGGVCEAGDRRRSLDATALQGVRAQLNAAAGSAERPSI
ncbi:MAG: (5-formylfuran-3-yl)methyl phosphate synthase [Pseudomonadota bacterium]